MKLETFFEKFDQFADAPDAVAKMRELVLELAVQGRLTSAFPRDGAVPSVVELRESAAALANSLGLRSPKESVEEAEPPFDVPSHWRWMALADIGAAQTGTTPSKADHDAFNGDVPFIKPADILPNSIDYSNESLTRHGAESGSRLAPSGSLLMVCIGTIGKCNLIERECAFNQQINSLTPVDAVDSRYLLVAARSRSFQDAAWKKSSSTTIAILNKGKWLSIPVPLPPLAEQKRIVAKVDELMALCDRLALQQQERETRHAALARASLARFADAPTPANLTFLFHPSYAISPADLRKSILTLAVQGKLVPQDPNDEPADSILRATHSFFDRLVAAKKLSAPKPLPLIEDDEVPFSLPIGWAWCRFGQIMRISSGDGLVAKDMNAGPIPVYGGNGVNGYHDAHNVAKRTLVIGRVGFYCGSIHVTPERAWVTDNAFITTFDEEHVDMDFLSWLLKATDLRERDNATAQPVISGGKVYPTVLAIPPLAEQRRIVAKVEQLMALVDALELQLAASRAAAENLLAAIVAELTEGTHASPAC
jgi:type I restriction enzyme S subunit